MMASWIFIHFWDLSSKLEHICSKKMENILRKILDTLSLDHLLSRLGG
jgi:hypothetical protein